MRLTTILIGALLLFGCKYSHAIDESTSDAADSTATVEAVAPARATLVFFGDAMQHKAQAERARALGDGKRYNFDSYYELIAPAVKEADYAVVNLEVPLGGGPNYSGYPTFNAPDEFAVALKEAGFDMFLTANNHCLDRNDKGARRTITVLDSLKVDHIGTYHDATARKAQVPFVKDINGIKVGFLNYTYGTNGIKPRSGAEVAYIDRKKIADEIKATREAGAEIIVVAMHWGIEYVLNESAEQRSLADFLVSQGVDMVIGGHPHVVQPLKVVTDDKGNRHLVVYSLGNFVSNMTKANTVGGAFVRTTIERDSTGVARFVGAEYDTFITERPTGTGKNFRVVPSWSVDQLPASQRAEWSRFNTTVTNLYDKYNVDVPRAKPHK